MIDERVELDRTNFGVYLSQRMDCAKCAPGGGWRTKGHCGGGLFPRKPTQ